jgi:2-polyprenyl-3-methyl-5-hydroxy-6-metoxy-1,4-benzoquinol methylase
MIEKIPTGSRVLEMGFGDGITFSTLAPIFDYTLVEGSGLLAERARELSDGYEIQPKIIQGYFESFEVSEPFDVVIASHVLEHVDEPISMLVQMRKWLASDGQIIVVVPNAESLHRRLGVILGLQEQLDELSRRDHLVGHQRVYNEELLRAHCREAGFQVVSVDGFFIKTLSNEQMINLTSEVIWGLCQLSRQLPANLSANLGAVIEVLDR